jgi:hypothetical protein
MGAKYIPNGNTKVVIDKITYQNNGDKKAVLPVEKLDKSELEGLLKRKFIVKLDLDEASASTGDDAKPKNKPDKNKPDKNKPPVAKPREELLKEAQEAGLTVTDEMTDEEIQKLIAEAKGPQV